MTLLSKDNFRKALSYASEEEIDCPICHAVIKNPILTACGHRFCLACLQVSAKKTGKCPSQPDTQHPDLSPYSHMMTSLSGSDFRKALSRAEQDKETCPICWADFKNPILTACGHKFCVQCLHASVEETHLCPICRVALYEVPLGYYDDGDEDEGNEEEEADGNEYDDIWELEKSNIEKLTALEQNIYESDISGIMNAFLIVTNLDETSWENAKSVFYPRRFLNQYIKTTELRLKHFCTEEWDEVWEALKTRMRCYDGRMMEVRDLLEDLHDACGDALARFGASLPKYKAECLSHRTFSDDIQKAVVYLINRSYIAAHGHAQPQVA